MDTSKDIDERKESSTEHVEDSKRFSEAFQIPEVVWWKHCGLRRLYVMMPILFLGELRGARFVNVKSTHGIIFQGRQSMDMMARF